VIFLVNTFFCKEKIYTYLYIIQNLFYSIKNRSNFLEVLLKISSIEKQKGVRYIQNIKGTVQRKLTGVLSGINRKLMICHCSDGHSFF
jgi:hypothetical protein